MATTKSDALTTVDNLPAVLKTLQGLANKQVLVGVFDSDEAIVGYVNEVGSPANNRPPTPFLIPGVEGSMKSITEGMRQGAKGVLDGNASAAEASLEAAGQIAAEAVKALAPVDTGKLRDSIDYRVESV